MVRISFLIRFKQRKRTVNLFITSHFSYYPLVWMFHSRRLNNLIDHIHERAFGTIYQDYNSAFIKQLLSKRQLFNKTVLIKCQKQKSFCILKYLIDRSSHRKCSVRKEINLQASVCNFIKKEALALLFSCEFFEISKNTSGRLLLI